MMMLKSLRKAFRPPAAAPSVPEGTRVYAIGDIHGRLDLLDELLERIDADHVARGGGPAQLIFLGDLIDRGPDSAGVVTRAMHVAAALPATRFLMGNHEEVLLKVLDGDERALRFFCRVGGRETILSYGIDVETYNALTYEELLAAFPPLVPAKHRDFIAGFSDVVVIGDYAFVHAGIRPGTLLADQTTGDLRWIREPFLDHAGAHEKIIVHGHTITADVDTRQNRIGIDTGAYVTGRLTALALEGAERWHLRTSGAEAA